VLLVVNAHGVARSLAALVKGYTEFDPELTIAGIVANHCGSERHGELLEESLKAFGLPPAVAAVPRSAFPELPSRHLGLVTADARNVPEQLLEALGEALERHGRVDEILRIARSAPPISRTAAPSEKADKPTRLRLGLAYDAAFHFYYRDNLEALEAHGCEIVLFSPLQDKVLPEGLDGLYIGGGYPEENAEALARNTTMIESVRAVRCGGQTGLCRVRWIDVHCSGD
jgi:cobyrinic acid a,c-diamide synthase